VNREVPERPAAHHVFVVTNGRAGPQLWADVHARDRSFAPWYAKQRSGVMLPRNEASVRAGDENSGQNRSQQDAGDPITRRHRTMRMTDANVRKGNEKAVGRTGSAGSVTGNGAFPGDPVGSPSN